LAEAPAVLSEGFSGFLQFLQANAGIIPQFGHDHFLADHRQSSNYPTIYGLDTENYVK
jgi:hypothetical protein